MPNSDDARPFRSRPFAQQVLANALGTLIAAFVIFVGGVAAGVIQDVPLRVWVVIAVGVVGEALIIGIRFVTWRRAKARRLDRGKRFSEAIDSDTRRLIAIATSDTARELTDDERRRLWDGLLRTMERAKQRS